VLAGRPKARPEAPDDMGPEFRRLADQASPFTMTSVERMYALYQAVRYINDAQISGDLVECGVWRGGSAMLAALTLKRLGDTTRRLWLYDTYEGMPPPGDADVRWDGRHAAETLAADVRQPGANNYWAYATLSDVQANLSSTGYPNVEYVVGKVEETIPDRMPANISLLRLDTDWYESTLHELEQLYPRLSPRGVLIIDDYGWWRGARRATDEYFADQPLLLSRIDFSGARIAVKPG
jgi:O-methyltransferase